MTDGLHFDETFPEPDQSKPYSFNDVEATFGIYDISFTIKAGATREK